MLHNVLLFVMMWCVCVYCEIDTSSDDIILIREDKCGETLDFSNMGITRLKTKFLNSSTATHLDLSKNYILEIENSAFDGLPNLKYLNLEGNVIFFENLRYNNLPTVETLILDRAIINYYINDYDLNTDYRYYYNRSYFNYDDDYQDFTIQYNKIGTLKKRNRTSEISFVSSMNFPKLTKLFLRQNRIKKISLENLESLSDIMPMITHLYLSDNDLTSLEFLQNFPPTLTHLYLDNNNIYKFEIGNSANSLKFLTLDGNRLANLCGPIDPAFNGGCDGMSVGAFEQLEYLSIINVGLKYFSPDAFAQSLALIHLNMSQNKIEEIDSSTFHNLINLKILILDKNRLVVVPNISDLKNLEHFSITNNEISSLGESDFQSLSNLKLLNLSCNHLDKIVPGIFNDLASLETLDLSRNKLQTLAITWISPRTNLKNLFLRDNLFSSFSNLSLTAIRNLQQVSITGNPLESIVNVKSLMSLSDNVTLDVSTEQVFKLP